MNDYSMVATSTEIPPPTLEDIGGSNEFYAEIATQPRANSKAIQKSERQLLGGLLAENANTRLNIPEIILTIRAEWFSTPVHQAVMNVFQLVVNAQEVLMPLQIAQYSQLKKFNEVYPSEDAIISDLEVMRSDWEKLLKKENQPAETMLEGLIEVVKDRYASQSLQAYMRTLPKLLSSDQGNKAKLAQMTVAIAKMSEKFSMPSELSEGMDLSLVLEQAATRQELIKSGNTLSIGYPTGFKQVDQNIGGYGIQRGLVYGLGGLSGMGKTTLALNISTNMAKLGVRSMWFSYEMLKPALQSKILASESLIPHHLIKNGNLDAAQWELCHRTVSRLGTLPIDYLGYQELKTNDISILEQRLRKAVKESKVDVVFVDHIALVGYTGLKENTETNRVTQVARKLSQLAKELNVAIVMLCQLNRGADKANKRPTSSDVKNSGAIWEECDVFLFVHRDSRFGETAEEREATKHNGTIIIAKNREGQENVDISVRANLECSLFSDLSDDYRLP